MNWLKYDADAVRSQRRKISMHLGVSSRVYVEELHVYPLVTTSRNGNVPNAEAGAPLASPVDLSPVPVPDRNYDTYVESLRRLSAKIYAQCTWICTRMCLASDLVVAELRGAVDADAASHHATLCSERK
ncbi:hypothetical protein U1Q18_050668 [Sarracenia purpurea var. burkii]